MDSTCLICLQVKASLILSLAIIDIIHVHVYVATTLYYCLYPIYNFMEMATFDRAVI